jgi:MFS transporter, DHA3 family, macrolide efflux protein
LTEGRTRTRHNLWLLLAANSVAQFAQGITMLAIPWAVVGSFGAAGGPLNATMVGTATLLTLGWSLYAGTLIDRYNRRNIFWVVQSVAACVLVAAAVIAYSAASVPFWLLAGVFTCTMFVYAIHYPNLYAFTQELFRKGQYSRINAGLEVQGQLTNILGMAVGSVLLAGTTGWSVLPAAWQLPAQPLYRIFLLNAATYVVAIWLLRSIRPSTTPAHDLAKEEANDGVFKRLRTGLGFLWGHPNVMVFGLCAYAVFFGALVLIQVLLPVYVQQVLVSEASTLATAQAALAVGAVLAAGITVRRWRSSRPPAQEVLISLACAVGLIALMASVHTVAVLVGGMLLYGVLNATARIHRVTYIQQQVPGHLLGRVHSSLMFVNYLLRAGVVFTLSLPFFTAEGAGGNIVYGMLGLAGLLAVALLVLASRYRKLVPVRVEAKT